MQTEIKKKRRTSVTKKILIGIAVLLVIAGIGFHIFVTRYLPNIVKERLSDVIVKGSDSLYKFEVGKFDLSFWGGSISFTGLKITTDSVRYKKMSDAKMLPPLTFELDLPKGNIEGIGIRALIFSKKIDIRQISFTSADIKLARHFRNADSTIAEGQPLWKSIQPNIKSIKIAYVLCRDLKINYQNVDSAANFHWQFDKSNVFFSDIKVDSASARDTTRLLFAKNMSLTASDVKLKTPDGLYAVQAKEILYTSGARTMEMKDFNFLPAVNNQQFINHFGFQHEIYKLKIPNIRFRNFLLPSWISKNKLIADTIDLASPELSIYLDRHPKENPYSKKGKYPHQLLQKAPFTINIKKIRVVDASMTYSETNNLNNLTGTLVFPSLNGVIDNITNDPKALSKSSVCIADVRGNVMKTGKIHTVFKFNLTDRSGAFSVNSTITNVDAQQMKPLFIAMTSVEIQSFNMKRIDYSINGNEDRGIGNLSMLYDNMDILINTVDNDKSLNKKGFLSFLANRLAIYKENPMNDNEERKAAAIVVQRDANRSFFNLVWKTMFNAAGEIVLRPMAQRKIERKKERALRRNSK